MKYIINIFLFFSVAFSQIEQPYPPLDLVTIPTSGTLPKGSYTLEALLIKDGGFVPKLSVGITDNFCIGLSYGIQDFISEEKPSFNKPKPEIQIKYRIYEESQTIPAIVLGLDTQGKGRFLERYNGVNTIIDNFQRYEHKAWGWYIVASKNWELLGNLGTHIGLNRNTWESDPVENSTEVFKDKDLNIFFGLDKEINRSFSILLEYDAAFNDNAPEIGYDLFGKGKGYLNAGIRWVVADNIMLEIDFNDISKNYVQDEMISGAKEYSNRELKIIYFEKF